MYTHILMETVMKTSQLCIFMLMILPLGAVFADFSTPVQVTDAATENAGHPAVDLDNEIVTKSGPYSVMVGNAHVVWMEETGSGDYYTYYRVVDPDGDLSEIEYPDREDICGTVYIDYISDSPTHPDILVNRDSDLPDISFLHRSIDWYYEDTPPDPVTEIIVCPKKTYRWSGAPGAPSRLFHASGFRINGCDPRIFPLGIKGIGRLNLGLTWSQWDENSDEEGTIYHHYLSQGNVSYPMRTDWGESLRCSETGTQTGRHPYMVLGENRASFPDFEYGNGYRLAVVSDHDGTIYCSIAQLEKTGTNLTWTTISLDDETWSYSMPTCCFEKDPAKPDLIVAFRAYRSSTEPVNTKYLIWNVVDVWTSNPSFEGSASYEITGDSAELPEAPPVIAINDDGYICVAYIGENQNVYALLEDNTGYTTHQISGDGETSTETEWVDIAVDRISLEKHGQAIGGKFCIVFDGEDANNDRHIYLSRREWGEAQ